MGDMTPFLLRSENMLEPLAEARSAAHESGILIVDKPVDMSSFSVVAKLKKSLRLKKAGHCGTLDPFATGVLLICVNQATRIADYLINQSKTYRFSVCLGVETDTLDRTGSVTRTHEGPPKAREEFERALERFRGTYLQQVPDYAAVKIGGQRLYKLTRKGVEFDRPQREVGIFSLDLLDYDWPCAVLEAHCSKGTYIRQLAADIGALLGCGAHVTELRRLASGPFDIDRAATLDDLCDAPQSWRERLTPMSVALSHLPRAMLEDVEILNRLRDGHLDTSWEKQHRKLFPEDCGPVRIVDSANQLVALWRPHCGDQKARRLMVFGSQ